MPPTTVATRRFTAVAYGVSASVTCWASSRVGTRTRASGACGSARRPAVRASSARPKARVLPEPVRPRPRTSRPASEFGRVAPWMGKGSVDALRGEGLQQRGGHVQLGEGLDGGQRGGQGLRQGELAARAGAVLRRAGALPDPRVCRLRPVRAAAPFGRLRAGRSWRSGAGHTELPSWGIPGVLPTAVDCLMCAPDASTEQVSGELRNRGPGKDESETAQAGARTFTVRAPAARYASGNQAGTMFSACGPFWPCVTSKVDLLALLELTEALGGDVRVVGEDVGAAAVLLDEAEALFRVEPLHGSSSHVILLKEVQCRKSALYEFQVAALSPIRRKPENNKAPEEGSRQAHIKFMGTKTATRQP